MIEGSISRFRIFAWCMSFILKKYFIYVFLFIGLVFLQQFCLLLLPKFIQLFIDNVTNNNTQVIPRLFVAIILAVIVSIFARNLFMLCKMVFCEKGTCDIQYSVVDKARILGYDYFENTPRGKMLAETYQNVLSIYFIYERYFPNIVIALCSFLIASVRIFVINPPILNILLIICYILIVSVVLISNKKIYSLGANVTEKKNEFYKQTYDLVEARDEILMSHAKTWFLNRLNNSLKNMFHGQKRLFVGEKKTAAVLALLQTAAITLFFVYSIYLTGRSNITVGEIVAVFLYLLSSIASIIEVVKLLIEQSGNLASAEKPYNFFKLKPTVVEKPDAVNTEIGGDIVIDNLSFSYRDKKVFDNLNLTIKEGEHVVIVGESGSGKTTLLKLLMRYYDIDGGKLLVNDIPISSYSFFALREYIGIVFQETFLFSGSVWDNLVFANPDATDDKIIDAVKFACMDNTFTSKKQLMDTELTSRGENLSGGERQRLSIARIYLKNPNIVLLDEVTSALDYVTENKVIQNLRTYFTGKTMIMVSHRLSAIQKFDRIIVLHNGSVVQDGTYEEVNRENTYFATLIDKGLIIKS